MKKKLVIRLSSTDPANATEADSLYEVLFAGLQALGHIPNDADCSFTDMALIFLEEADGKLTGLHGAVIIEAEISFKRKKQHYPDDR